MLDEADPDVLNVCTPSGAHLDAVLATADRGIDVLCEKPLEIIEAVYESAEAGEPVSVE